MGKTLEERVHAELDSAVEGGYKVFVMGDPEDIAIDLCAFSSDVEHEDVDDVTPHVKSWQEKRRAQ